MTFFHFSILSLAVYRISILFAKDAGPWGVFTQLRWYGKVFNCMFCISIWIALVINVAYYFLVARSPLLVVAGLVFAMSAITIMLDRSFTSDIAPK